MIEDKRLEKLRLKLKNRRGSISAIARKVGVSTAYVSQVLAGKRYNAMVIEMAIDKAAELNSPDNEELAAKIDAL